MVSCNDRAVVVSLCSIVRFVSAIRHKVNGARNVRERRLHHQWYLRAAVRGSIVVCIQVDQTAADDDTMLSSARRDLLRHARITDIVVVFNHRLFLHDGRNADPAGR